MNYTLNNIKEKLQQFATDHLQVNEFALKDPLELLNASESRFPAVVCLFRPSNIQGNYVFLNIDLLFMDLVHKDLSNELDVLSDQLLIALDCRAYLNNPLNDEFFTIMDNANLQPFYEKSDNEVTGWQMSLQFKIIDLKDRCQIPL